MEAAGLIAPAMQKISPIDGEWSRPMSMAEFGRRMFGKKEARARDVQATLDRFEKQRVGKIKWTIRLDVLPTETRKKLEGEEP
jgi:hypothetical protein